MCLKQVMLVAAALMLLATGCGGEDTAVSTSTIPSTTTTTLATTTVPTTTATVATTTTEATTTTIAVETTTTTAAPLAWTRVPEDEAVFGGASEQWMECVTAGGPGLVAVGAAESSGNVDAAVWTSADGISWSRVPHDETIFGGDASQVMSSVMAGGPGLVAVGSDGPVASRVAAVWTSADGITWSRVPDDAAVLGGDRSQLMSSVTAGGPGLVAVGWASPGDSGHAAVWTSADGITWSRVPHDETVFGFYTEMSSVTAGGPGLVAVGWEINFSLDADGAVWTSADGITWSRVTHSRAVFGGEGNQEMISVTAGGPGVVAVGSDKWGANEDAAVWTSPDGISWSRVTHNDAVFGGEGAQRMIGVTAGGPGLVAVGWDGSAMVGDAAVWVSADGITWARVPHDEAVFAGEGDQIMWSITTGGPGLVAVGWDGSGGDQDAAAWTAED